MKKIKTGNKKKQKAPMKKSTKILLYSIAGIALLMIIVLVTIENRSSKIIVKNNTDIKLEYIKAYFVDMEGPVSEDVMVFENLSSGDRSEMALEKLNLAYREANLEVKFKFEGYDELFEDVGYFSEIFDGRIYISFKDTGEDGKVLFKTKASTGVIPSPYIECDEEHIVNLTEGYVEE